MTPTVKPIAATALHAAAAALRLARPARAALALAASLALAACGGGGEDSTPAAASPAEATPAAASATPPAPAADTAASAPSTASTATPALVWNTAFPTNYQLKSAQELGLDPMALNNKGEVAGTLVKGNAEYAAIWKAGSVQALMQTVTWGEVGCYKACSASISQIDDQGNLFIFPAYYGNGTPDIQLLRRGATSPQTLTDCLWVHAVTPSGEFLCNQWTGPGDFHTRSALWHLPRLDKTVLSGDETAMNPAGTLAGVSQVTWGGGSSHVYLFRQKGAAFTFLEVPDIASAKVTAINAQDVVVGHLTRTGDDTATASSPSRARPFMWKGGDFAMLPCPQTYGWATDINRDGSIVGECQLADGTANKTMAVLWRDGQLVDLSARVAGAPGWALTGARRINDQGWIVAYGEAPGDSIDGSVLLIPQP